MQFVYNVVQQADETTEGENDDAFETSSPKWLIFQTAKINKQEKSSYDILLGKFNFKRFAGKSNVLWLECKTKVLGSTFTSFNCFIRDVLKQYARELDNGFPKGMKINHSQTLAISHGFLLTFPNVQQKYAIFLAQSHTGEANNFKSTTLKLYAHVILFCCFY